MKMLLALVIRDKFSAHDDAYYMLHSPGTGTESVDLREKSCNGSNKVIWEIRHRDSGVHVTMVTAVHSLQSQAPLAGYDTPTDTATDTDCFQNWTEPNPGAFGEPLSLRTGVTHAKTNWTLRSSALGFDSTEHMVFELSWVSHKFAF